MSLGHLVRDLLVYKRFQLQNYYRKKIYVFWIDGRLCLRWFLKSGGRTWIDMEFRGGVKLRIINFAKTVTCTLWFLLFQPFPSKTRAYFTSFQHISFTATVFRLRKANVYVDGRVLRWTPQKTAKHFDTSLVTLLCKKMKCNFDILAYLL